MNLARNLEYSARFFPDNPAVIDGEQRFTYAELNLLAGRAAAGLGSLGLGPGDFAAVCAPNSAQWLAFYFGALKLGCTVVTLSNQLTHGELEMLLGHARPKAIMAAPQRLGQLESLRESFGLESIICPGGDLDFEGLVARGGEPLDAVERERSDIAAILYTGGTTGVPKGVMLSHENINTAIGFVAHNERSDQNDRALCFLPFNHVFGQMHIMNATVLTAGGLVLLPGFELEKVLDAIKRHKVTKLYSVPTIYVRLLQVEGLKEKLCGVRYCFSAAASMARELVNQWKAAAGLKIYEAYGMTESASMVTYNHYHRHLAGSVGTPAGTVEVSIRDAEGQVLPQGQEGEICIRGRNIMKGYLNNPEATQAAFHDDWFRSGDVGCLDEDGYLFIVDRLKDMIITGGENVYPREVEEVLYQRPEVAECAVIGLPDAEYGERVTAYLVPRAGAAIDPEDMKAFCKKNLSAFKVPKEFISVSELPTSPAGKVLKRELRRTMMDKRG